MKYQPRKFEKREKPYKFITLSFDDGVKQDIRFIELLDKYGLKCTFNLNSGLFGLVHNLETPDFVVNHSEVEKENVAKVYGGHEVASHSLTHPRLDWISLDEVKKEIGDDCRELRRLTGQEVCGMAYPGGPFYNEEIIKTIVDNTPVRYARITGDSKSFALPSRLMEWQPTCSWRNHHLPEWIEEIKNAEPDEDMLLYVWGHTYEFDVYDAWEQVEELLKLMSGDSGITYATNGEIANYIMNK